MRTLIDKISSIFFPRLYVRASEDAMKSIVVKQKKSLELLDKYDKGHIDIDYSAQLERLKKFTRSAT